MSDQRTLDLGADPTAGEVLDRIHRESWDESEKGRWFELPFMRVALQQPEFEIDGIWRWPDWPEREGLTSSPRTLDRSPGSGVSDSVYWASP